jgi:hypothetical protein
MNKEKEDQQSCRPCGNRTGFRGREERVFSRHSLGGFAGGGAEKTPAGGYSINTRRRIMDFAEQLLDQKAEIPRTLI